MGRSRVHRGGHWRPTAIELTIPSSWGTTEMGVEVDSVGARIVVFGECSPADL